jgi:hypothetical protein
VWRGQHNPRISCALDRRQKEKSLALKKLFISVLLQKELNLDEVRLALGLLAKSDIFLRVAEIVSLRQAKRRSNLD